MDYGAGPTPSLAAAGCPGRGRESHHRLWVVQDGVSLPLKGAPDFLKLHRRLLSHGWTEGWMDAWMDRWVDN